MPKVLRHYCRATGQGDKGRRGERPLERSAWRKANRGAGGGSQHVSLGKSSRTLRETVTARYF